MKNTHKYTQNLFAGLLVMMTLAAGTTASAYTAESDSAAANWDTLPERSVVIETNLVNSINSPYEGVRETAIFNAIMFRSQHPDVDTTRIIQSLNALLSAEEQPRIRHKAHIALFLFENDNFAFLENAEGRPTESDVYRNAAELMNTTFLSTNEANQ